MTSRPAAFPLESQQETDSSDTLNITVNGERSEYKNALGPGPGGSKVVFIKEYKNVDGFEFSFDFWSSNEVDHLHMLVANGQATYMGDSVPLTRALSHLETG